MKKLAKLFTLLLVISLLAAAISGCGGSSSQPSASPEGGGGGSPAPAAPANAVLLKAGHVLNDTHAYNLGFLRVAELIDERTGGALKLEVFPNSTIGNERDLIEGMQLGTTDMAVVSTGPLSGFSSAFLVLDLPFIFNSYESAYRVLDGEIGQGMLESLTENQMIGIAFWENGFRNVTSKMEVRLPEDVKGIKIRTMEAEVHMATFNSLGAIATPMAWGEVYTALQQGTIDAQENPLANIYLNKMHEVNPYINMTGHFYAPAPVLMSKKTYDSLPPEQQQIIVDAVKECVDYERQCIHDGEEEYMQALKDEGAYVIEDIDKAVWRAACQPVYDQYRDIIGEDLIKQVEDIANS